MRIILIIAGLSSGGSERAMSVMANYWAAKGHDVTLLTLATTNHDFYALHPKIRRVGLGLLRYSRNVFEVLRNNVTRVKSICQEVRKARPDLVISFGDTTNVLVLLANMGVGLPVIVCEQIDPRQYWIGLAWELLRRVCYPKAAALVVVASAMVGWAERIVGTDRIRVIPNPVYASPDESRVRSAHQGHCYTIVAMGRLVKQKGFDLLLNAFERCKDRHPDWILVILGEGEERPVLEALSVQLGIEDRIRFLGRVKEPATILRQADLFVLSSRFEGFPLALIEAMACGLPAISTDCPTGPSEIIRNGIDGILISPGDVNAMAAAIDRLMANPAERERLGAEAIAIVDRFGAEQVMTMWDQLVAEVAPRVSSPEIGTGQMENYPAH